MLKRKEQELKRWAIFPIQHMDLWEFYKKAQKQNWVAEEVDLSSDRFSELTKTEQDYLKNLLAFFAVSDGMVIENLAVNFMKEVDIPEAQYYYGFQTAIEQVHAEMYGLLVDTYMQDPVEKDKMFFAAEKLEAVKKKAGWAINWISSPDFVERLVAFACVEGIAFSSTFAGIFWFRSRNKMLGLCQANELIMNDENSHYDFATHLYNNYIAEEDKLSPERIEEIVLGCYDVEKTFIEEVMPEGLDGLTRSDMVSYVQYVVDTVLVNYGLPVKFGVSNPLDFMNRIAITRKGNFFENRGNNEYTRVEIPSDSVDMFKDDF